MLGVPLDGRALAERIAAGDKRAKACFRCFGEQLCDALQPQIEAFCPDTLCMGGQIMASAALFLHPLEKLLYKQEDYFIYYTGYFSADYAGADKSCQPVGIYQSAYISGKISVHGALQIGTRRISGLLQQPQNQGKTKGLAACNSQTTNPFGCLNNFYFKNMTLTFWDHLKTADVLLFIWRKNHVADCFIE